MLLVWSAWRGNSPTQIFNERFRIEKRGVNTANGDAHRGRSCFISRTFGLELEWLCSDIVCLVVEGIRDYELLSMTDGEKLAATHCEIQNITSLYSIYDF